MEAFSDEEAKEKGFELLEKEGGEISLCYQCSREIEINSTGEIEVSVISI